MTYEDTNPVYALNSYVWKLLEKNLGWKKKDYNGIVPIIPISQQPELLQTGKPFLVYGSSKMNSRHLHALKSETVSYSVYGTSVSAVNKVINLLADTFDRQDEAAVDVNGWLDTESEGRGVSRGISFGSVGTSASQKAEPADEEGGFVSGFVLLDLLYTKNEERAPSTSGFTYP